MEISRITFRFGPPHLWGKKMRTIPTSYKLKHCTGLNDMAATHLGQHRETRAYIATQVVMNPPDHCLRATFLISQATSM